ncbi:hypothetical protein ACJ73_09215, partial [Blastomyces percursus]
LLITSGCYGSPDHIKKGYLRSALNLEIMSALIGTVESPTFEGFCEQLRSIENQMLEVERLTKLSKSSTRRYVTNVAPQPTYQTPPQGDTMD